MGGDVPFEAEPSKIGEGVLESDCCSSSRKIPAGTLVRAGGGGELVKLRFGLFLDEDEQEVGLKGCVVLNRRCCKHLEHCHEKNRKNP